MVFSQNTAFAVQRLEQDAQSAPPPTPRPRHASTSRVCGLPVSGWVSPKLSKAHWETLVSPIGCNATLNPVNSVAEPSAMRMPTDCDAIRLYRCLATPSLSVPLCTADYVKSLSSSVVHLLAGNKSPCAIPAEIAAPASPSQPRPRQMNPRTVQDTVPEFPR